MKAILLKECDIYIDNGEIRMGDNRMDMIENIIDSNNGEWKENRYLGVGIKRMIAMSGKQNEIRQRIMENMNREEIEVKDVEVVNEEINIEI